MRVADWSVVGLGGVLVVVGLAVLWRSNVGARQGFRAEFGGIPLVGGLAMPAGKLPRLLGAPYPAVMAFDAASFVCALVACALVWRTVRRRPGGGRLP